MSSVQVITTVGDGVYHVPADATVLIFDAMGGGGGGQAGDVGAANNLTYGGQGGAGGARSLKVVSAAQARTAFPDGIPYSVGAGGAGGVSPAGNGAAGGFTFAGDFVVGVPGGFYGQGLPGLGDTAGGFGGVGGGFANWLMNTGTDATGSPGGEYLNLFHTDLALGGPLAANQAGGGGGGGGGGGIQADNTACNGGDSGFVTTSVPAPLAGMGGTTGGGVPRATGPLNTITAVQGGGGGGAASTSGNGQAGANAIGGSGSGGGGGGAARTGHNGGAGGAGGSGYLIIAAIS